MQKGQPAQAPLLIGPQLAGKALRGRQRIGGLLLVVLLQHRLQAGLGRELMHRQPHQGVALAGGQPQGLIQGQRWIGSAEALGIAQIPRPQLDPGALVLHQRAALGRQALEVFEAEGDTTDHQLPLPFQGFAQCEALGTLGQLRHDRQPQAAGQAAR